MNELIDFIKWTIEFPIPALIGLVVFYIILFTFYNQKRFKYVAYAAAPLFVVYDFIVNVTAMSILMLDPPREWLVTHRLKRYKRDYMYGDVNYLQLYRFFVARKLCEIANKFDEGHC